MKTVRNKKAFLKEALALTYEQVTLRLVHKDCIREFEKVIQKQAFKDTSAKKNALNDEFFLLYKDFMKDFSSKFTTPQHLNEQQIGKILSVNYSERYKTNEPCEFEDIDSND
jgi:hypothetical protein